MHDRNETVDGLRALAALAVCFFHFTGHEKFRAVGYFASVSGYGGLGVEIFFVISGFIVPYSMYRAGYSLSAWPTFMLKRLVRLEPPYIASIVVVMVLGLATTTILGDRAPPLNWTPGQIAGHLGYVNALLGMPWLNVVYWSLAIEFQFYVSVALLLPPLLAAPGVLRIAAITAIALMPMVFPQASRATIVPHLPIFAAGLLTFLFAARLVRQKVYWAALAALAAHLVALRGWPIAIATIIPAVAIATLRLPRVGPMAWVGAISYSLYLMHVPIGSRVVNMLANRLPAAPGSEVLAAALALVASIGGAYLLYRWVEVPSRKVASRMSYAPSSNAPSGLIVEGAPTHRARSPTEAPVPRTAQ